MSSFRIILLLSLIGLILRFPYFFPAVIDWDESTFILMGQNILDGNLPYTKFWDLKPPLTFYSFAFFIFVFGKSILAIRLGGFVFLIATSYILYLIGKQAYNKNIGILSAILCIVFVSLTPSGQATMTEIVALLPLMLALYILIRFEYSSKTLFLLGVCIASAFLVRLNLAYVAVGIFIFLFFEMRELKFSDFVKNLLIFISGSLFVMLLISLPYLITNQGMLLFDSVFRVSLEHTSSRLSISEVFIELINKGFGIQNLFLWGTTLIGIFLLLFKQINKKNKSTVKVWVFFISILYSIIASGSSHEHYLIQIVPVMAILSAVAIGYLINSKIKLFVLVILFFGLLPFSSIFNEYKTLVDRSINNQKLEFGPQYEIAQFLEKMNPKKEPIYLMTDHIIYWFMNMKPPSKVTLHPSNIAREYMVKIIKGEKFSSKSELVEILTLKPLFIVKNKDVWYLKDNVELSQILEKNLSKNYTKIKTIEGRNIYKRKSTLVDTKIVL